MYLSKEELKEARERRETALLNKISETALLNETLENKETKTPKQRYDEAEKKLDKTVESYAALQEKYKKIRQFIEEEYSSDANKDLIFSLLLAFLVNEKQVKH